MNSNLVVDRTAHNAVLKELKALKKAAAAYIRASPGIPCSHDGSVDPVSSLCEAFHHPKEDYHDSIEDCPCVLRYAETQDNLCKLL